jgi:hypothetical protein
MGRDEAMRFLDELEAENAKLRAALKQIAEFPDGGFGYGIDAGDIAREALKG